MTNGAEPPRANPGLISGVIGMVAPAVIRTIPMDEVVGQLDVNAIAERLDLDALMARLDMDALVDRLDVNAIANMLDLDALMKKIDMGQITAGVTGDVAVSGVDLVRRQLVRADATVDGVTDRILRRQPGDRPVAPARLEEPESEDPDTGDSGEIQRRDVSGHYAGPVTRLLGLAGDFSLAFASWGIFWAVSLFILGAVTGSDVSIGSGGWVSQVLILAWLLVYFWIPVGLFGRTPVMALIGLAVVRRDGGIVDGPHAFGRALFVPVSSVLFIVGLIGIFVGKERRALYDLTGGTVEVYDWGSRDAEQPVSIRQQLSARVTRRRALRADTPPAT